VFGTLTRFGPAVKVVPDPWVGADQITVKPSVIAASGLHPGEGVVVALTPGREITGYGSATKPTALRQRALERFQLAELDTAVPIPTPDNTIERQDLTSLFTFTIDGPDSRDLDDAISVVRRGDDLVLYVHIADVASAVPLGSPADLRARALATSVYLPGYSLPMFPPELSYDECSLLPDVVRRTITVEYAVTPDDLVTQVKVYHSLIRSNARLTYEQVARALEGAAPLDPSTQAAIELTNEATTRLGVARAARGGLVSDRFEPIFDLSTKNDQITAVPADDAPVAHDLIEEAMVAANEAVGSWLREKGLEGVYRVHPAPGPDVIAAIEALALALGIPVTPGPELTPHSLALVDAQLRTHPDPVAPLWAVVSAHLERAYYQPAPGHHFGLASEVYVHFTSPIRRYADLTVHRIISAHLTGTTYEDDLEGLCAAINAAASLAARAESAARNLLWACFLRALPDAKRRNLNARIVKISEKGVVVALNEYGASGWILARDLDPAGVIVDEHCLSATGIRAGKWELGQAVAVNVGDIDVQSGLVSFRAV
jgi:ribonuclease R